MRTPSRRCFPPRHGAALIALALGAASACGGAEETASGWAGSVDTLPGGGLHVRNPREGTWTDAQRPSLVEGLRIGAMDGEGPDVFGQVRDVELDGAGRLWVLESQANEIRVFGRDGAFVRTVATSGEGPGELKFPVSLFPMAPDLMVVLDVGNARFEVFDSAGARVAGHPLGGVFTFQGVFDRDGTWIAPYSDARSSADLRQGYVRYRLGDAGLQATADTFARPEQREAATLERTMSPGGGGTIRMRFPVPFVHNPSISLVAPGRLVVVDGGGAYLFRVLGLAGDTLRVIEREYAPLPVTTEERADAVGEERPGTGDDLSPGDIPENRPPFEAVTVADDGSFWVERTLGPDTAALDVFNADGRYLGAVDSGVDLSRLTIHRITGDAVYGVLRDDFDVPSVVRLDIVRPGG